MSTPNSASENAESGNSDAVQQSIVDQNDEVRDPADDSGEFDDPSALVETYPPAFDERIAEAEAAIDESDRRSHPHPV